MNSIQNNTYSGDVANDICYFISIVLCALRACDVITCKWYWIIAPIGISWLATAIITIMIYIAYKLEFKNVKTTKRRNNVRGKHR